MTDAPQRVECEEHGGGAPTHVCQHLATGQGLGFHYGNDLEKPDVLFPDAWCDECDAAYQRAGGWTEESEKVTGIKVLCSACYQRVRLLNWPRDRHVAFAQLLESAVAYLKGQQDILRDRYQLNDHERYDWDQDTGQLIFSSKGTPALMPTSSSLGRSPPIPKPGCGPGRTTLSPSRPGRGSAK